MAFRLTALAGLAAGLIAASAAQASPVYAVSVAGTSGAVALAPSADSVALSAATASTGLGSFSLQSGTYNVGDSGQLTGIFGLSITELVTVAGQTVPLVVQFLNNVTVVSDFLTVTGGSAYFSGSGLTLTVGSYTTPAYGVLGAQTFSLQAVLSQATGVQAVGIPEPAGLLLVGTGIIGMVFATRRRDRRRQAVESLADRRKNTGAEAPVRSRSLLLLGR